MNRVQAAPRIGKAIHKILHHVQSRCENWVGSSVVHLGDHNVPNHAGPSNGGPKELKNNSLITPVKRLFFLMLQQLVLFSCWTSKVPQSRAVQFAVRTHYRTVRGANSLYYSSRCKLTIGQFAARNSTIVCLVNSLYYSSRRKLTILQFTSQTHYSLPRELTILQFVLQTHYTTVYLANSLYYGSPRKLTIVQFTSRTPYYSSPHELTIVQFTSRAH